MSKIIFYIGDSPESWSPKTIKTGIGGSEEATIYLAKEMADLGHEVIVYNKCGKDSGNYGGVEYKSYLQYDNDICDLCIFWRDPTAMLAKIRSARAKKKVLWLHDTISESEVLPVMYLVDKVAVLSNYHRNLYPHIPNERIFLTQNGVELSQFGQKVKRNPKKMIWTSSYDRGLKELLECWTEIKLAEPKAELHIYYGWETMKKIFGKTKEYRILRDILESLFDQQGVYHHGRVGHKEIAREMLSSGVWPYPTWWPEISCISAMKAQIAGAIPVIIPTAAVKETVRWGFSTNISYDIYKDIPEKVFDNFTDLVIKALDEKEQEKIRQRMIKDSRERFNWKGVAGEWTSRLIA